MDLWGTRRRDEEKRQAERARARLGALRPRRGWVPRVPGAAGDLAMLGVQAERMDFAPGTATAPDGDTANGPRRPEPEEYGPRRPEPEESGDGPDAGNGRTARPGASNPPGRYRAGGAVADRLPLPLRVVAESLPSGVRGGEAGLQRMHAVVIGALILAGLGIALVSSGLGSADVTPVEAAPSSTTLETGTPLPASAESDPGDSPEDPADDPGDRPAPKPPDTVVVHVAGKVARPGIVELPDGSRVVDAVEAAGGAEDGVDLSTLNLARILVDGEQVAVGIEPVARPRPSGEATGDEAEPVVDLNTATPAELESLPGIGPALAANIVAWRDEHGRFTVIEELQEVSGIGPAKLAALADRVTL